MDQSKRLRVVYSPNALADLKAIWIWNVSNNGLSQANSYKAFIRQKIRELTSTYRLCCRIEGRQDLYYSYINWSSRGHGHVAVFSIDEQTGSVIVANIFHSSQDWKSRLERDSEG